MSQSIMKTMQHFCTLCPNIHIRLALFWYAIIVDIITIIMIVVAVIIFIIIIIVIVIITITIIISIIITVIIVIWFSIIKDTNHIQWNIFSL